MCVCEGETQWEWIYKEYRVNMHLICLIHFDRCYFNEYRGLVKSDQFRCPIVQVAKRLYYRNQNVHLFGPHFKDVNLIQTCIDDNRHDQCGR